MTEERITQLFDEWAARGRDASMEQGHSDVVEQVIESIGVAPGEQILDLGCGNGWATRLLAKAAPGAGAVGVDVSPGMIAKAEALHSLTIRARYEVAAFERLPFPDERFDRAFSMEAIYYAVDLERALAELFRVLKPGAQVDLILDFYAGRPGCSGWPAKLGLGLVELDAREWREELVKAGFTDVASSHVVDRRGPGDPSGFEPSDWWATFEDKQAYHSAGSLHLTARRPS